MTGIFEKVTQQSQTKSTAVVEKNPLNLAASWYVAMPSKDLGKKLKQIELFGRQLVAWRDQNGQPVLMEAYCSHMGASLALGKITDDCIQCPFHHWRYDNSGNCVSIPDIENVPPTARQVTYNTAEKYGYIWVWYGSVTPLFPLPEFSAAEDEKHNYMPWRIRVNTKTTVRRVLENIYDHYHIIALHHMPVNGYCWRNIT
ncbi:Rieske 2Fe-2S domain-containing protein [Nostoc sp. WHI]|uniref:Rieske 2Fe-2S domain-containing protein n=1 Tax=Nostoc sp. WHI TaxID=2650611 RepID=UPI0018C7E954|nr:Rieske 2Fe-2S domain-containing protein [Nostoc sp. WHI]MBG1270190.1 Rieske 2Fe-2S domain-containing protein [Nostoc sp. WHI]